MAFPGILNANQLYPNAKFHLGMGTFDLGPTGIGDIKVCLLDSNYVPMTTDESIAQLVGIVAQQPLANGYWVVEPDNDSGSWPTKLTTNDGGGGLVPQVFPDITGNVIKHIVLYDFNSGLLLCYFGYDENGEISITPNGTAITINFNIEGIFGSQAMATVASQ